MKSATSSLTPYASTSSQKKFSIKQNQRHHLSHHTLPRHPKKCPYD
uniref:Uncharacterized protein n=1 Tax=Arundo donax TaxID=35708 RepID=A0A0A9ECF1_ARUDO